MTHRNSHDPDRPTKGTLCLTLLFFAAFSAFPLAQERYTVNRPITTPPKPIMENWLESPQKQTESLRWETDYRYARRKAEDLARYLLIYLYADSDQNLPRASADLPIVSACTEFGTLVLEDDSVRSGLDKYVLLKMPMDAKVTNANGETTSIYSLPGFEHMLEQPGLVVIDFSSRNMPFFGEVVGILPFMHGESPTAKQTEVFLNLPPGTLTQRTLTYAVRIHPDHPLSSNGEPLPIVVWETTAHALYQAERGIITHQNYGARSARVREILGGGSPAEICAMSQSGISLFEGAMSCMRLWRYSSAHWSIARKEHTYYGYDMALGKSGAWHGVGFFINLPTTDVDQQSLPTTLE